MSKRELTFGFKSETPGANRYCELDNKGIELPLGDAVIGTVYLRKKATPHKYETIKITLEIE